MATGRINKKVLDHIASINKEAKQMQLAKDLKKEFKTLSSHLSILLQKA